MHAMIDTKRAATQRRECRRPDSGFRKFPITLTDDGVQRFYDFHCRRRQALLGTDDARSAERGCRPEGLSAEFWPRAAFAAA